MYVTVLSSTSSILQGYQRRTYKVGNLFDVTYTCCFGVLAFSSFLHHFGWRRGVVVTALVISTKLLYYYVEPS